PQAGASAETATSAQERAVQRSRESPIVKPGRAGVSPSGSPATIPPSPERLPIAGEAAICGCRVGAERHPGRPRPRFSWSLSGSESSRAAKILRLRDSTQVDHDPRLPLERLRVEAELDVGRTEHLAQGAELLEARAIPTDVLL